MSQHYRRMEPAGGEGDVVLVPINAFLMAENLPDAQLIMYPDASHGAQSQHAEIFLEHVKLFLAERTGWRAALPVKTATEPEHTLGRSKPAVADPS